ncbi:MAG: late competence development ComFB family protein [Gemmatimonadaceae bacterium]
MINALEDVVRASYLELRDRAATYCRCQRCEDDVLTYAMNNLRPRYVGAAALGAAVTRVALEQDASKAEIAVVVLDAMRKVARRPRHDGPDAAPADAPPLEARRKPA